MGDEDEMDGANVGPEEIFDQYGNKIEVNKAKTMTDKERKKAIKEIEKKLKDHKKKNTLSDAEMWELQDKLAELKNDLGCYADSTRKSALSLVCFSLGGARAIYPANMI